jgi:hypothetical protein
MSFFCLWALCVSVPQPEITIEDVVLKMTNDWHLRVLKSGLYERLRRSDLGVADQNRFLRELDARLMVDCLLERVMNRLTEEEKAFLVGWYNTPEGRRFFNFDLSSAGDTNRDVWHALTTRRQEHLTRLIYAVQWSWCQTETLHRILLQQDQLVRLEPWSEKETFWELERHAEGFRTSGTPFSSEKTNKLAFYTIGYAEKDLSSFAAFLESDIVDRAQCILASELWLFYEGAFIDALAVVFPGKEFPSLVSREKTRRLAEDY